MQPQIKIIPGGMRKVMQSFLNGDCRAAIVRDKLYNRLSVEKKKKIKIIATSKAMPNQAISIGNRVNSEKSRKIIEFLTSPQGSEAAEKLLQRYSAKNKVFIPVKTKEFTGLERLLEGIVYGW